MRRFLLTFLFALSTVCSAVAQSSLPGPLTEYLLQPGDSVEVLYRYTPEYNQTVTVQPDGAVALTLLGNVPVRGLTVEQARTRIRGEAAKRLNEPEVSLALKDFDRPHFTVLGEVANPGRFELRGSVAAVDALAMAGGLKTSARHTNIILIHRLNQTVGEAQLVNIKSLEKPKSGQELITVQDGDLLIVPQSKFSKVERFVKLSNIGVYYPL